jgi:hypothetical protein
MKGPSLFVKMAIWFKIFLIRWFASVVQTPVNFAQAQIGKSREGGGEFFVVVGRKVKTFIAHLASVFDKGSTF